MKELDLNKVIIPGIVWYNSKLVEALKGVASPGYTKEPMKNGDYSVIIRLSQITYITENRPAEYSPGPTWEVGLSTGMNFTFSYETGLGISLLWKRSAMEGGFTIEHDKKRWAKQKFDLVHEEEKRND